jgi:hypothetical protein
MEKLACSKISKNILDQPGPPGKNSHQCKEPLRSGLQILCHDTPSYPEKIEEDDSDQKDTKVRTVIPVSLEEDFAEPVALKTACLPPVKVNNNVVSRGRA